MKDECWRKGRQVVWLRFLRFLHFPFSIFYCKQKKRCGRRPMRLFHTSLLPYVFDGVPNLDLQAYVYGEEPKAGAIRKLFPAFVRIPPQSFQNISSPIKPAFATFEDW